MLVKLNTPVINLFTGKHVELELEDELDITRPLNSETADIDGAKEKKGAKSPKREKLFVGRLLAQAAFAPERPDKESRPLGNDALMIRFRIGQKILEAMDKKKKELEISERERRLLLQAINTNGIDPMFCGYMLEALNYTPDQA